MRSLLTILYSCASVSAVMVSRGVTPSEISPINALRAFAANNILELAWVQDFTASENDDLKNLRMDIPDIFNKMKGMFPDSRFALAGFADKPMEPHGSNASLDYCFRVKYPLTNDVSNIKKALDHSVVHSGRDWQESQLHAMLGSALSPDMRWSMYSDASDGRKIAKLMVIATDAGFHVAGDSDLKANNADGNEECLSEDYPSVQQVTVALEGTNIIPIFLTTKEVAPLYRKLVKDMGNRGAVSIIGHDSADLEESLSRSLTSVLGADHSQCGNGRLCCYAHGCCSDYNCDEEAEVVIRIMKRPKVLELLVKN